MTRGRVSTDARSGPWWSQFISRFGVPTGFAAALLYVLIQVFTGDIKAIKEDVGKVRDEHLEMRFFLRAICINGADTEPEQANCIPPGERRQE